MAKYRIHIDPSPPDPQMVERHQDFDSLYKDYQTQTRFEFWRNLYRNPRNFGLIIMLIAVTALVWQATTEEEVLQRNYALYPPDSLNSVDIQHLAGAAEEGRTLQLPGVKVEVPAQAWLNDSGEVVKGNIQFRYRLIRGPQAAFEAGVPRPWDQTNGMARLNLVEIEAYQQDQRLSLRDGYALKVSWKIPELYDSLEVRYLSTSEEKWLPVLGLARESSLMEPNPGPPPPPLEVTDLEADTLIAKSARQPIPPSRPFGTRPSNLAEFPELRGYENVYWAHIDRPGSSNPWEEGLIGADRPWSDVRIRKVGGQAYELRFARQTPEGGIESRRVLARPLLQAESEAEALAWYRRQMDAYEVELANIRKADSLRTAQAVAAQEAQAAYEEALGVWLKAQQDGSLSPFTALSYEVPHAGVSGFWLPVPYTAELQEWTSQEEIDLLPALQPWCYAARGDTLLPLHITGDNKVELAPEATMIWLPIRNGGVRHVEL